ncbi:MAG: DUF1573 domain-containing protein [Planctomycetes bacterium]|nr:DUF1573 domain-containing protein [Planctomycetota bacterium]
MCAAKFYLRSMRSYACVSFSICGLSMILLCQGCSSNVADPRKADAQECVKQEARSQPMEMQQVVRVDLPRIVVDKMTYDFAEVRPDSKKTATFRLTNAGSSTLRITDVQRCCGAVVKLEKKELSPGESGVLTTEFVAGSMPQALNKKIRLLTNDPEKPQIELAITGKVVPTLAWTPPRFEIAAYQEIITCPEITIKSLDGKPFAVKGFSATGACLTADFDPSHTASELTLKPQVDRAKLAAAEFSNGRVKIEVTHPDYEAIYLDFAIKPVFEITPARIFVVNAEPGRAVLRTLQVQDRRTTASGDVAGQIESVTFKDGGRVEVRGVTNGGKGCEMSLAIWPAGEQTRESLWSDQLLIQMKEGRQLTIPVHVLFKTQPL